MERLEVPEEFPVEKRLEVHQVSRPQLVQLEVGLPPSWVAQQFY